MADQPAKATRPPDYNLNCLHKDTNAKGRVGAAWIKADGSIGIMLDPFVILPPGREILLTLFKNTPYTQDKKTGRTNSQQLEEQSRKQRVRASDTDASPADDDKPDDVPDDDVPF